MGDEDPSTVSSFWGITGVLSHQLRLRVGLHHQFFSSVLALPLTDAVNRFMKSRAEKC